MATGLIAQKGSFSGRTVIVTGGGGAIGRSLCVAFGEAGANVVVNDVAKGPAEETAEEVRGKGGKALAVALSNSEGEQIVTRAVEHFGGLDIIVNCAGVQGTHSLEEEPMEEFQRLMEGNAFGGVSLVLAAWPYFKKKGYGRVVNFTSETIFGSDKLTAYVHAKGAIFAGTRALAAEGAKWGILANCVAPVAWSKSAEAHLAQVDEETRNWATKALKEKFPPMSNVPMVLALSHESSKTTGEGFVVGAWSVSRIVLGVQDGITKAFSMEECLKRTSEIIGNQQIHVPKSGHDIANYISRGKN